MVNNRPILVVSFGSSHEDTCEKNIGAIERDISAAYPNSTIHRAFTSGMIIRKLRIRDDIVADTVTDALEKLVEAGTASVIIQPTHILNGEEYEDILADAIYFKDRLSIAIGKPLLTDTVDYIELAEALDKAFPAQEKTTVCLMGHGTSHFADVAYAALDYHFKDIGRKDIFVGTLEGFPDLGTLRRHLRAFAPENILLAPLMIVAGEHARNDMAGSSADSWKSVLQTDGYHVDCVLKGLGEYPAVRSIYRRHVRETIKRLGVKG